MKSFCFVLIFMVYCSLANAQTYQQMYNDAAAYQKKGDFYTAIKKYQAAAIVATPDQKKNIDRQIDICAGELNKLVDKALKEKQRADELLAKSNELLRGLVPDTVKYLHAYFYRLAKIEMEYCRFESALRYLRFTKLAPDLPENQQASMNAEVEKCEKMAKYNSNAINFYRTYQYAKAKAEYQKILQLLPGDTIITKRIEYCDNPVFKKENFADIKGGTFTMGDGRYNDNPKHDITLTKFAMYKYEISNAEFVEFFNIYGSDRVLDGEYKDEFMIDYGDWGIVKIGKLWKALDNYDNYPAIRVSWFGANEFAKFWNANLPTEAQWEYAAQSGEKKYKYSWGDTDPSSTKVANLADESYFTVYNETYVEGYDDGYIRTAPVNEYQPNEFGLFNLSGNVWEWCSDWYAKDFYNTSVGQTNPLNTSRGAYRVIRGGSWSFDASYSRTAYRNSYTPGDRTDSIGFRLVLVP